MAVPDKLLTITFTMCLILSLKSATNLGIGIVLGGMKKEKRPAVPPATMSLSHVLSFALECLRPFSVKSRTQLSSSTTMTTGTSLQSFESKAEILLSVSYGIALQKFERDEPAFEGVRKLISSYVLCCMRFKRPVPDIFIASKTSSAQPSKGLR
jgi:hypothetical protein